MLWMDLMTLAPFHLAFPVNDLAEARVFYGGLLGCAEGRSDGDWIDFNFGSSGNRVGEFGIF